jgi:hypothetical protein
MGVVTLQDVYVAGRQDIKIEQDACIQRATEVGRLMGPPRKSSKFRSRPT